MLSVFGLMMLSISGVGCGDSNKPADPPAPGKGGVTVDDNAAVVEEGAVTPMEGVNHDSSDGPGFEHVDPGPPVEAELEPGQDAVAPGAEPTARITEPAVYWVERHAERSPFPAPGETITDMIAPARLTDADPFALPIDPEAIPTVVPWTQAAQYLGHTITVEGEIVRVGKSGQTNFLNFAQDYRGKFYLVLFDDLATTLPDSVPDTFEGKTVRVRGTIEDHRGTPQLKITSMDQVEFVEE